MYTVIGVNSQLKQASIPAQINAVIENVIVCIEDVDAMFIIAYTMKTVVMVCTASKSILSAILHYDI